MIIRHSILGTACMALALAVFAALPDADIDDLTAWYASIEITVKQAE